MTRPTGECVIVDYTVERPAARLRVARAPSLASPGSPPKTLASLPINPTKRPNLDFCQTRNFRYASSSVACEHPYVDRHTASKQTARAALLLHLHLRAVLYCPSATLTTRPLTHCLQPCVFAPYLSWVCFKHRCATGTGLIRNVSNNFSQAACWAEACLHARPGRALVVN